MEKLLELFLFRHHCDRPVDLCRRSAAKFLGGASVWIIFRRASLTAKVLSDGSFDWNKLNKLSVNFNAQYISPASQESKYACRATDATINVLRWNDHTIGRLIKKKRLFARPCYTKRFILNYPINERAGYTRLRTPQRVSDLVASAGKTCNQWWAPSKSREKHLSNQW